MPRAQQTAKAPRAAVVRPRWSVVLRALRDVAGVSQAGWVALLQLAAQEQKLAIAASEDTLQRWEAGRSVPDAATEAAIIAVCRERGLLRAYTSGALAGVSVTAESLQSLLAEARLGGEQSPRNERSAPVLQALPARPPSNLPAAISSFIGRERELAEVEQALAETRLLTLTGPGGVGKTRLSLEVAGTLRDRFPEGVWLVELAPLVDAALVPRAVADALGLAETAGRALTDLLVERLHTTRCLLLLDNCEHLIEASAVLVAALLRACPSLCVLATSRQPLGIAGERVWRVPPLSLPDLAAPPAIALAGSEAAQLFLARAGTIGTDVTAPKNAEAVAEICRRLDGIPLALELAAARTRALTVEQIAQRLEGSFRLLGSGNGVLPRHQTIQAAIDWSHEMLTEEERTLFRRLAVLVGGFTLEAAEALCADPPASADIVVSLSDLVDKSLVVIERGPGADAWYRLLEPLRQYAAARLEESGEGAWLRTRHADWYLALVEERGGPGVKGAEQAYWLSRMDLEHDNVRAALRRAAAERQTESGLRLATALKDYWLARGHFTEGASWIEAVLASPDSRRADPRLLAAALSAAGILAARQGDYRRARARLEEGLDLARAGEDPLSMARALNHLGITAREQGDLAGARVAYDAALEIFEQLGDRRGIAVVHNNLGNVARAQGRLDDAVKHYGKRLAIAHESGDEDDIAEALHHLGSTALDRDDLTDARTFLEDSLARRQRLGAVHGTAGVLATLGTLAAVEGDFAPAEALFEESLALARRGGHDRDVAQTLRAYGRASLDESDPRARAFFEESLTIALRLGDRITILDALAGQSSLALAVGDAAEAEALARESLSLAREVGFRKGIGLASLALAAAARERGRLDDAAASYRAALSEARDLESIRTVAACFEGLAALSAAGEPAQAARLLGTAAALRERIGVPLPRLQQPAHAAIVAHLRASLEDGPFEQVWASGRSTPLQTAIEDALSGA